VFEPALIGTWVEVPNPDTTWTFEAKDDTTYTLIDTRNESEPGEAGKPAQKSVVTTRLTARLLRVGQARFLDICPGDNWTASSMLKQLLVYSHAIAKIRVEGDTLHVAFLDEDWLENMLGQKKIMLRHESVDADGNVDDPVARVHSQSRRVLLTAPTPELREFLAKYASSTDAFSDDDQMRRKAPAR
jgi:hypothetical protein